MSTILYAEDDRDCRELFAFVLRQRGHTVYEAINGAQAVQLVRDEAIDLAILDVRMPMMTGYDAAKQIAQEAPSIPVIFFSVKGLDREVNKGFKCGAMVVDYLIKPIGIDHLVERVENVLSECKDQGLAVVREQSLTQLFEMQGVHNA